MMFEISFGRPDLAARITQAVDAVLERGYRTRDLLQAGGTEVGTREFSFRVQEQIAGVAAARTS